MKWSLATGIKLLWVSYYILASVPFLALSTNRPRITSGPDGSKRALFENNKVRTAFKMNKIYSRFLHRLLIGPFLLYPAFLSIHRIQDHQEGPFQIKKLFLVKSFQTFSFNSCLAHDWRWLYLWGMWCLSCLMFSKIPKLSGHLVLKSVIDLGSSV